jgi:hypothetical protein
MTTRKTIKSPAKSRDPRPIEIYASRRIAGFDAAEADLGRFLNRKRQISRPKSPAARGPR